MHPMISCGDILIRNATDKELTKIYIKKEIRLNKNKYVELQMSYKKRKFPVPTFSSHSFTSSDNLGISEMRTILNLMQQLKFIN